MAEEAKENVPEFPYRVASPEFFFLLQRMDRLDEKLSDRIDRLEEKLSAEVKSLADELKENRRSSTAILWTGVFGFLAVIVTILLAAKAL